MVGTVKVPVTVPLDESVGGQGVMVVVAAKADPLCQNNRASNGKADVNINLWIFVCKRIA